jgi:hypothetical protein
MEGRTTMLGRLLATVLAVVAAAATGACNDVGTCPSPDSITPGGSCSGDSLECAYTLQTPSPACDGTDVEGGLATSCVCTKGSWVCPSAVVCPSAGDDGSMGGDGDDGATGDDGSTGDDTSSGDSSSSDSSSGDDGSTSEGGG